MAKSRDLPASAPRSRARASLRIGKAVALEAEVRVTERDLLSIAALVSLTLLSTAALVRAARRRPASVTVLPATRRANAGDGVPSPALFPRSG